MKKAFKTLFLILLAVSTGCGVKGSPKPPFTTAPETVKNVSIKQQDRQLVVYWRYTPVYADGRKMKEEFRFDIFTLEHRVLKNIYREGNLYWFYYKFSTDKEYCFRFKVRTRENESRFSRYFCYIPTLKYPEEQPELTLSLVEEGILLEWNLTQLKVNVYRHSKKIYYPITYVSLRSGFKFTDRKVQLNRKYCYYITFEDKNGVESSPSKIKCITFRDVFPPLPPENPQIIERNGIYYLIWSDSPSGDVVGYIVTINDKPVNEKPVRDYSVVLKEYKKGDIIKIYAVDRAGNKSRPAILK
ncbi:hypothetical protein [Persephonella sp.]